MKPVFHRVSILKTGFLRKTLIPVHFFCGLVDKKRILDRNYVFLQQTSQ